MKVDISIVIGTYNRCESLAETLNNIFALACDGSFTFELIIVDNNSNDKTKEVVEDFIPKFNGKLKYIFEPKQGISYARNCGIQEARGEYVVCTDDDCLPNSRWLQEIFDCFKITRCDAIGGRILPGYPPKTPQWIKDCKDLLCGPIVFHDYGEGNKLYEKPMAELVGANMAFRRELFEKHGYFRTDIGVGQGTMGDETEFIRRLQSHGCKIYYCGKAVVIHPADINRLNLKYIAEWNIKLGRYRFMVDEKGLVDKKLTCYLGVPRYLIKEIVGCTALLILNIFNRRVFLREWKELTIRIGRISGMRKNYLISTATSSKGSR